MRSLRPAILAIAFILFCTHLASARHVRGWTYQELFDKSDLVVIATATDTKDTKEQLTNFQGFVGQPVIGVETKFEVDAVLKGNKGLKELIMHHYRADKLTVVNGPNFATFDPAKKQTFMLFLVRESDGRYASAVGQIDPKDGIKVLMRHTE